jgi:hypothetical protein
MGLDALCSDLNPNKFDSSWRSKCSIEEVSVAYVDHFIREHYLGKRPAVTMLCLAMMLSGWPIGCAVFAAPPREVNRRYGTTVWELARLFIVNEVPRNAETWFIGKCVRHIKRTRPSVGALLSYADPSAGHKGTIYRAANWRVDGMTDEDRASPRWDLVDEETGKRYGRASHVPEGRKTRRLNRISKHRFVLKLRNEPPPPPESEE